MASPIQWRIRGELVSACNCDWGCPCNFDARPTDGWCGGAYVWHIREGLFGDIGLDGLYFVLATESPGPIHEGHMISQAVIDSSADEHQREVLLNLAMGENGGPFAIFAAVTETFLDPIYAPFEATMDGLKTRITVPGVMEMALTTVKDPVTGRPKETRLVKPTGFTSRDTDLGATTVYRFSGGFQHDYSGKYGEYARYEYSGP